MTSLTGRYYKPRWRRHDRRRLLGNHYHHGNEGRRRRRQRFQQDDIDQGQEFVFYFRSVARHPYSIDIVQRHATHNASRTQYWLFTAANLDQAN